MIYIETLTTKRIQHEWLDFVNFTMLQICEKSVARRLLLHVAFTCLFVFNPLFVRASEVNPYDELAWGIALPGEKCRIEPSIKAASVKAWTDAERWAWWRICEGKVANFNHRAEASLELDPRNSDHDDEWSDGKRTLSRNFLRTILLHEPFRSAIPHTGVQIRGAYFPDGIDLNDAPIERVLGINKSFLESHIHMQRLVTPTSVSLVGSKTTSLLDMSSSLIGGSLFLREAEFSDITLGGIMVKQEISLDNSRITGVLDIQSGVVAQSLFIRNVVFKQPARLMFAEIGSTIDMRGAILAGLDLTGSRVERELRLSTRPGLLKWMSYKDAAGSMRKPKLNLQNVVAGTLQDTEDTWPEHLERELEGLSYIRLGGFEMEPNLSAYDRDSEWFVKWLKGDESFSPQPYQQLAGVLQTAGHGGMADDVLVAGRERERGQHNPLQLKWWELSALKVVIGYGYGWRYFWVLTWVLGFVLIGTVVLHITRREQFGIRSWTFWQKFFYSLDLLLPVIRLNRLHYEMVNLKRSAKYYFYIHQILGYVLISFLIAGLSGVAGHR